MAISTEFQTSLINHEGIKNTVYTDSKGYLTVGIGTCVDSRVPGAGLLMNEMLFILNNRIDLIRQELWHDPWYDKLDQVRQDVITEMAFNMGVEGLLKFVGMIQCIKEQNYHSAAVEARCSKWAIEVSANRLDNMMYRLEFGEYPKD